MFSLVCVLMLCFHLSFRGLAGCVALAFVPACDSPRASLYLFILSSFPSFFFNLLCDSEEGRKGKDKTNERLAISFLPFYRFSPTTHPLLERSELKKPKVDGEVVGENPKGKKEIQESREMS